MAAITAAGCLFNLKIMLVVLAMILTLVALITIKCYLDDWPPIENY